MCNADSQQETAVEHRELSSVLCDDLEGWDQGAGGAGGSGREAQEGEGIADSWCCPAETNTTL